ncbi:tryptophan 2,3-dioxygenase [Lujinxingia litoralis]|nr:tryptophan 2,3-dioxygenase family protein [Lujinxingia litoralis]
MSDEKSTLSCPFSGDAPRMTSGGERLTYNSYLKVPQLLELQNFESSPAAHDELLFIVIHQAYELWFKLILFELDQVAEEIEKNEIYEAGRLLQRVLQIEKLLVQQIHVLETMTPRDFLRFRSALNPASGFQSIQFREVEFLTGIRDTSVMAHIDQTDQDHRRLLARLAEPSLRTRFYRLLEREGFEVVVPEEGEVLEGERLEKNLAALLPLYRHPEKRFHLYTLAESLVEHDQNILLWRFHHVRVVERLLGTKPGTGGSSGVAYLSSTLEKRAYPQLWQVRGLLSDDEIYGAS